MSDETDKVTTKAMLDQVGAIARALGRIGPYGLTVLTIGDGEDTLGGSARSYTVTLSVRDANGAIYPHTSIEASVVVPRDGRDDDAWSRAIAKALRCGGWDHHADSDIALCCVCSGKRARDVRRGKVMQ